MIDLATAWRPFEPGIEKRFFIAEDGGMWWIGVARDREHFIDLLAQQGAEWEGYQLDELHTFGIREALALEEVEIRELTGCSIEEAIAVLRPTPGRGTQHKRLIRALMDRGVRCGDRFVSVRGKPLPHTGIVRITYPNKRGHVVVKNDRTWFDPLLAEPFRGLPPDCRFTKTIDWSNGGRITSSLWLGNGMP